MNAEHTLVASFLNLTATTDYLRTAKPSQLVIVCGGTYEEAALEDTLAAGAIAESVWDLFDECDDASQAARLLFASAPVEETLPQAKNAQRLLSLPDLAEDVEHCLQSDRYPFTATVAANGMIRRNA